MTEVFERIVGIVEEGSIQVILPLILISVAMFFLVVERSLYLFGSSWAFFWPPARRRLRDLETKVSDAFDNYIESPTPDTRLGLIDAAKRLPTPYGRFFLRLLEQSEFPSAGLRDLELSVASLDETLEIERGLGILSALAKAAPLFGLLGTVMGMIQTFKAMMLASTSDPKALSSGISIALIATEVGLIVAMPGVVSMSWLSKRAQSLQEEIGLASMRLKQTAIENAGEAGA
jgi:biopolymer transport protein ExbB/TolQ